MVGVFFVKFMDYCFIICHTSVEPKSAVVSSCQGLSVHFACTPLTYCVFIHNCGETFDVMVGGRWRPTRIEMAENWYLVGIHADDLSGLRVRI